MLFDGTSIVRSKRSPPMATTTLFPPDELSLPLSDCTVKELSDSGELDSVPPQYNLLKSRAAVGLDSAVDEEGGGEIPTIDFSLLTGGTPEQRSGIVRDLGKACQDWGFFMVINHGVPERMREDIIGTCREFFDLSEDEKKEYAGKHLLDPIRCGTSFNTKVEDVKYWRDFVKIIVHPEFHSPDKPPGFRKALLEYSRCVREMTMELLRGISESLGLVGCRLEEALGLDSGLQILAGNFYPPCPQPEVAMGMPPHSDHGLLTVLLQNDVDGLQVKHSGKWIHARPAPNSFLVNTGDHLEREELSLSRVQYYLCGAYYLPGCLVIICLRPLVQYASSLQIFSNGRYKSVLHRATLNSRSTRMSIAVVLGPSPETVVAPAPELATGDEPVVAYRGMKYQDYLEYQQGSQLKEKSVLNLLRVPTE